jgi:hypothetical protein
MNGVITNELCLLISPHGLPHFVPVSGFAMSPQFPVAVMANWKIAGDQSVINSITSLKCLTFLLVYFTTYVVTGICLSRQQPFEWQGVAMHSSPHAPSVPSVA